MIILKGHKDSNGNTVSYTLSNDGNIINMSSADTIKLSSLITNAYLTSNNEFRAKAGYSIETVVDTSNLSIRKNTKLEKVSNNIGLDYYGKEFINICRRIRTYAISKKVRVDKGRHRSNKGLNLNIYKLIETADEVLQTRIHYIKTKLYDQYEGWDWQTWHYITHCWGRDHNQELEIDFESCFNDGIPEKEKDSELYKRQWMSAHMPETWEEAIDYMN